MSDVGAASSGGSVMGQLDVQYIVSQLIYAKQQPIRDLEVYESFYEAKNDALQELNTKVSSVESALYNVINTGFESKTASLSQSGYITASATTTASEGTYSIRVKSLAVARSDASGDEIESAIDKELDNGSLVITDKDGTDHTWDFAATNKSLNDLSSEINALDVGISATVIQYGDNDYRIHMMADETGTDNDFSWVDTTTNLELANNQAASDAEIYVNNPINDSNFITRSTNTVNDVISGVTLNLLEADTDETTTITIDSDSTDLKDKIQGFVDAFNDAMTFLNEQFTYDEENERAGILSGETVARKIKEDLLSFATTSVENSSYELDSFSLIGIEVNRQGMLEINEDNLDEAISDNLDAVKHVFKDQGSGDHSEISYVGYSDDTVPGSYDVVITQAAEQAITPEGANDIDTLTGGGETLTITYGGTGYDVVLAEGLTSSQVLEAINTQMDQDNDNVPVYATIMNGKLRILTENYGSDEAVSVVSDKASAAAGTTGIGTSTLTDNEGADVAGTLSGLAATGSGQLLTGTEGDAKGLQIYVTTDSVVGDDSKGTITFSKGIGELLRERMYETSFPYTGLIATTIDSFEDKLENISEQISAINRNLAIEEEILIAQFTKANEALGQMEYLKSTIAGG